LDRKCETCLTRYRENHDDTRAPSQSFAQTIR
jgi:hypothetical protein